MPRKTSASSTTNRKKKNTASVPAPMEEVNASAQAASLEEEIRRRAYQIYLERNGSPGDENQDWLTAEREVLARHHQERVA